MTNPNLQSPISSFAGSRNQVNSEVQTGERNPQSPISNLLFLKLGGSLITDKNRPHTPRLDVLERLADEILAAHTADPGMRLIVGHGSGSFGHVPAKKFGTRQGVHTLEEWLGFAEVWQEAVALNRITMNALNGAGLPALSFPPSASVVSKDGKVYAWDLTPLKLALQANLLPVVYGDTVFDLARGGTILSTEDLFDHLARQLRPRRILLAGLEPGVWADFPACTRLVGTLTPANLSEVAPSLGGSAATDVTGGMASKVQGSLDLVQAVPGCEVCIFSGEQPGMVREALLSRRVGTVVRGE